MSRIGKLPIQIPSGVTITVDSDTAIAQKTTGQRLSGELLLKVFKGE